MQLWVQFWVSVLRDFNPATDEYHADLCARVLGQLGMRIPFYCPTRDNLEALNNNATSTYRNNQMVARWWLAALVAGTGLNIRQFI